MITYTIKKGDTVSKIAKNYKTTVAAIKKANPNIKNIDKIYVGQKILIPTSISTSDVDTVKSTLKQCLSDIEKLDSFKKLVKLIG